MPKTLLTLLLPLAASWAGPPAAAPTPAAAAAQPQWNAWYTVTVGKSTRYAYYNDKVEFRKDGKVLFQNKFWKKEEGYINEEALGAVATNNADLSPQFFNFHSNYRTTETKIDGAVQDGKSLAVRVRKGTTDLPIIRRLLPDKAIFSVFFPVWLGKKLPAATPAKTVSFMTILEDNVDIAFSTVHGYFRLEAPDELAKARKLSRLTVNYRDLRSTWYVHPNGLPERIEMPAQKTLIERVTEAQAKAFLDE